MPSSISKMARWKGYDQRASSGSGRSGAVTPVPPDPITQTVRRSYATLREGADAGHLLAASCSRHEKARRMESQRAFPGTGDRWAEIIPFLLYNLRGRRVFLKEKTRRCGLRAPAGSTRAGTGVRNRPPAQVIDTAQWRSVILARGWHAGRPFRPAARHLHQGAVEYRDGPDPEIPCRPDGGTTPASQGRRRVRARDLHPAPRGCPPDGEGVPRSLAGCRLHDSGRVLAGATRRRDRVHHEAAAERGLREMYSDAHI